MRRYGRGPGSSGPDLRARPAAWGMAVVAFAALGLAAASPGAHGAERLVIRLAAAVKALPRRAPALPVTMPQGHLYDGTPAVGALFTTTSGGGLGQHFCTATVVASRVKDLVITAAHCVAGRRLSDVDFVPGYHRGHQPYGSWKITQMFVDSGWASSGNPDDDVAFLVVTQSGSRKRIEDRTGGDQLATGWRATQLAQVIGYPNADRRPITCTSRTKAFGPHQMEFDCGRFTDGTSGGPFLAYVDPKTGRGNVLGVIGGYQQGGNTPSVSYSPRFGPAVRALYNEAVARN
jgi:V8-like Glu-specific endopeptidase